MPKLIRFGVSLEKPLLDQFDRLIAKRHLPNRSEAFRELIRRELVREEWHAETREVAGAVTLVYDHHKRDLVNRLMDVQHEVHDIILASQHVHLDHHNCLEIIAVKGKALDVATLAYKLKAVKGIKHSEFTMTTTGKGL